MRYVRREDALEGEFSEFIDKKDYDDVQEALFRVIREAFVAGWKAGKKSKSPLETPQVLDEPPTCMNIRKWSE